MREKQYTNIMQQIQIFWKRGMYASISTNKNIRLQLANTSWLPLFFLRILWREKVKIEWSYTGSDYKSIGSALYTVCLVCATQKTENMTNKFPGRLRNLRQNGLNRIGLLVLSKGTKKSVANYLFYTFEPKTLNYLKFSKPSVVSPEIQNVNYCK